MPAGQLNNPAVSNPTSDNGGLSPYVNFRGVFGGNAPGAQTPNPAPATPNTNPVSSYTATPYLQSQYPTYSANPQTAPANTGGASTSSPGGSTNGASGSPPATGATTTPSVNNPFGGSPFMNGPTGYNVNDGSTTNYNPAYFGTQQTANQIASMTGGTATQGNDLVNAPGSPFTLNQLENMVTLPNGQTVNAGQIANIYSNGYNSSITDPELANALNFGNGGAGKGVFTVQNGQITYNPNGSPTMLGYSSPAPNSPTSQINQAVALAAQNNPQLAWPGNPSAQAVTAGGQQNASQNSNILSQLQQLFTPQVQSLYGGNPFTSALSLLSNGTGNQAQMGQLGNVLNLLSGIQGAGTNQGSNMTNIASLLNALFSTQQSPSNGVLSPLFWGNQTGAGLGMPSQGGGASILQLLYPGLV